VWHRVTLCDTYTNPGLCPLIDLKFATSTLRNLNNETRALAAGEQVWASGTTERGLLEYTRIFLENGPHDTHVTAQLSHPFCNSTEKRLLQKFTGKHKDDSLQGSEGMLVDSVLRVEDLGDAWGNLMNLLGVGELNPLRFEAGYARGSASHIDPESYLEEQKKIRDAKKRNESEKKRQSFALGKGTSTARKRLYLAQISALARSGLLAPLLCHTHLRREYQCLGYHLPSLAQREHYEHFTPSSLADQTKDLGIDEYCATVELPKTEVFGANKRQS